MSFLGELKRRNVFRVAGVYAVVGWLAVQVAASLEEAVGLPEWFDGLVVSLLVIGLPVALVFAWAFELTPDGIKRTVAVSEEDSITAQTASKLDAVLVVALFVFAAAMLIPRFLPSDEPAVAASPASEETSDSEALAELAGDAAAKPPNASFAVLPFADLSPDGNQEYFADGISEELLNVLAQVKGMKVAGRTSSFAFKGRNEDLREIGKVLSVAHILEGSVRSQGDKVRVTAQLIQVSDGYHLWSQTYDGDLTDIFAVQDDIAQEILTAMRSQFELEPEAVAAPTLRTDISAYNLFLTARDQVATRDKEAMTEALASLTQAIAIDPNYAPALALRAQAYIMLSDRPSSYGDLPAREAGEKAAADLERALVLDPDLAHAHAVRGLQLSDAGRPDAAISSLRRAIELNPNSLDARNWLALALSDSGRFRAALDTFKGLLDIDPLYAPGVNNAVTYSFDVGDLEGAREIAQRYVNLTPSSERRMDYEARLAALRGDLAEALRLGLSIPQELRGTPVNSRLVFWSWRLGIDAAGEGIAAPVPTYQALVTADLGFHERAMATIHEALRNNPGFMQLHSAYFQVLYEVGRDREVMAHYAQEFGGDVEQFATRLRSSSLSSMQPFYAIAGAAKNTGDEATYTAVMRRWRETIDNYRAGGAVGPGINGEEATYFATQGDFRKSIELCKRVYEQGLPVFFRSFVDGRALAVLRNDTRIIEMAEKSLSAINQQRAELGRPPLESLWTTQHNLPN
ncbi:MAG: hypothetical protein Cons2KO_14340 [Congregibacter sp.]